MSKKCTRLWREARFQVNMYKTPQFGPLLEVEMSKECTLLWRETHFEIKSVKNWRVRTTFGRSDVVLRGRRKGLCTWSKVSKTWSFVAVSATTTTTLHYIVIHYTTLHYTTQHYTTPHYTTLHYTQLHYNSTTPILHYITLHSTALCYTTPTTTTTTTLLYTTLHYPTLHYTRPLDLYSTTANTLH